MPEVSSTERNAADGVDGEPDAGMSKWNREKKPRGPALATERETSRQQIRREYLVETAHHTLRQGQIFAALTLPFLAWYIYQDHLLGFGLEALPMRGFAVAVSALFLLASWTVLPGRPRLTLWAHGVLLAGPVINSAGLAVVLFLIRPETAGFQEGVRGALFITLFAAFAFAGGVRRQLWAVVGLPILGMAVAFLATGALSAEEWTLFTDIAIAVLVVAVVGFRQERIHYDEFKMRRWATLRKDALEQRLRELRQLNRQLQEFAYLVSHDLKEPLRTVTGFLGLAGDLLAAKEPDLDKVAEFLGQAQDGAERMSRLMEGLLTYSRLDTASNSHRVVGLDAVMEEAKANLAGAIRESEARILQEPLPKVVGDPGQLAQLFQNLLSNALKYHRPGIPPEVTIQAKVGPDKVTVIISDNGIGIDPKHHDRIFRLFQRLHTRQEFEGTGVGLAVVRRIAERHGGEVTLVSSPGAGATFRVTLLAR